MTWFKVDDKLHDHRKARAAGSSAMGLWVLAGSWSADNLTDGFVPDSICARWDRSYGRLAAKLVGVGFWVVAVQDGEEGWRFHEWEERQPTRAQVDAGRQAARERMAKLRDGSASVPANSERSDTEVLVPVPSRPVLKETSAPRKRGTRLPDDWKPNPFDVEWQRDNGIPDDLARRELPKFVDYWAAKAGKDGAKLNWSATWRNWLRNTLERQPPTNTIRPQGWETG